MIAKTIYIELKREFTPPPPPTGGWGGWVGGFPMGTKDTTVTWRETPTWLLIHWRTYNFLKRNCETLLDLWASDRHSCTQEDIENPSWCAGRFPPSLSVGCVLDLDITWAFCFLKKNEKFQGQQCCLEGSLTQQNDHKKIIKNATLQDLLEK